ncbi:MAG: SEL1-like repeat protein [Muribaculaceae bacterium]|nr:SEL1-like repeat protein [Muribaculaceae bacterium]
MRRYTLIILIIALAASFTIVSAQRKKSSTNKKTENVAYKSTLDQLRERADNGDAEAMLLIGKAYYGGSDGAEQSFKTAAKWFADAAEANVEPYSTEAKGWLGLLYYNGEGVKQDHDRAMKLFLIATRDGFEGLVETFDELAKDGDIFACKFMQECYNKGVGVKRNTDKAAEYQRLAADAGDEDSYMPVGLYLYNNDKHAKAFKYFEKAAKLGNARAAYFCGLMLYDGDVGVEQNKAKGLKYLQMAADEGHVAANSRLGEYYLYGNGLDMDKEKGAKMIKVAAEKGNNKAMWVLANCYRLGEGVPKNYALAAQWMALVSSANKADEYKSLIADLKSRNDPFYSYLKGLYEYNITGDYDAAMDLFKTVEKAKVADGITMQGVVLTNKNYKKRDIKKAAKMFEKASNDSPLACYYLSFLMEKGNGVKKDEKGAIEMLTKAADGGCAQAQCRLGDKYIRGTGVEMDIEEAAKYYLLAEAQHAITPEAARQLARLYENEAPYLPEVEDLNKHIDHLKKTKENNSLINMLAGTKF